MEQTPTAAQFQNSKGMEKYLVSAKDTSQLESLKDLNNQEAGDVTQGCNSMENLTMEPAVINKQLHTDRS